MVQKSAKEEEIEDKGSKYRIYIPVYMELHTWEQMQYLLSLPLISSSFAPFCTLLALSEFAENQIFRAVAQYTRICLSLYWHMFIFALKPACNNKQPLHCWKVADIASYSLVLVPFPRFFLSPPFTT